MISTIFLATSVTKKLDHNSLAGRLLENRIPLPVISEILGHSSTETTMAYLRVDIEQLRNCALEVSGYED